MNKTKIEWCDFTWNPIKGLCPVGCWYCYARKMYKRFKWDEKIDFLISEKDVIQMMIIEPARIFVCSTMEMFHPNIPSHLRDSIFYIIEKNPRHTFIILTKMPENIDRPMPDNTWLGVSVTGVDGDDDRIRFLCNGTKPRVKFVSFEPLLGDLATKGWNVFPDYVDALSWCIMGRLTGHGHVHDPTQANIKRIYQECRNAGIPVFLKDNLRGLWKGPFVQEFPMETCT